MDTLSKIFTILFITLISININAQKEFKDYHDTGNIAIEGLLDKNGKKTGEWTVYSKTGVKESIIVYHNDIATGIKHYYNNGVLEYEGGYLNGKKSGIWIFYFENGNKNEYGEFVNGKISGIWKFYYENGNLKKEGSFDENNEKVNFWKIYDISGNLDKTGNYKNGKRTGKWDMYSNGKVIDSKYFQEGKMIMN